MSSEDQAAGDRESIDLEAFYPFPVYNCSAPAWFDKSCAGDVDRVLLPRKPGWVREA